MTTKAHPRLGETVTSEARLTVDDLVSRWRGQVKAATLATWRSRGFGPKYMKLGGRVLYTLTAVEEYEARNTRGA